MRVVDGRGRGEARFDPRSVSREDRGASEGARASVATGAPRDPRDRDERSPDGPTETRPPPPSSPVPSRESPRPALDPFPIGAASEAVGVSFPTLPGPPAVTLARHGRARRRWTRAAGTPRARAKDDEGTDSPSGLARARHPRAAESGARAGSPVAMQARSGRRAADVPARDGVRHAGVLRGGGSPRTRVFSGGASDVFFFRHCRRQPAGIEIKKTLSPPRKRAGRAQRGAQRTTCEHERRSW